MMVQVLNQDETPLLYSLVFGEGVVNDATSVVLFNAIHSFDLNHIDLQTALHFSGNLLYLFLTSTMLGVLVTVSLYFIFHAHNTTCSYCLWYSTLGLTYISPCSLVCLVLSLSKSCILAGIFMIGFFFILILPIFIFGKTKAVSIIITLRFGLSCISTLQKVYN